MIRCLLLMGLILPLCASPAHAGKKKDLATEMNELRPVGIQVDKALEKMATSMPKDQQEVFQSYLRNNLDYRAIEKISIDAMAGVFTEQELEAMVEYYKKPEARSAADKLEKYQKEVSPEIIRMIDRAMMKARTGAAAP